jgi:Mg/Co/Ni transporter MgtE
MLGENRALVRADIVDVMKFIGAQLKTAIIKLLGVDGYSNVFGEKNERHSKVILTKLRDTLIPKLISGELRVPIFSV